MRSNTESATRRATHYHDEAIRLLSQAETADEVWVQRQLRDIAQHYELVAKTIEMIEGNLTARRELPLRGTTPTMSPRFSGFP